MLSRRELFVSAAALAVIAACGSDDAPSFPGTIEELTAGGERARLMVPPAPNGHVIVYHHGAGEDETAPTTDGLKRPLIVALLNAGYVVASSNAAGENWGNDASVAVYRALDDVLAARFAGKVVHLSQSMGGLSGLLAIADGIRAAGWVGIYPVCNLADMAAGQFAEAIADSGATRNPIDLDPSVFAGLPMRFYASPKDTVVAKAENADRMAALVAPVAAEADVIECVGDHGDPSHFQPDDVLAFVARCVA